MAQKTKTLRFNPEVDEYEELDPTSTSCSVTLPSIMLDLALRPGSPECLALDFSLPQVVVSKDPRLNAALVSRPACMPALTRVTIRVSSVRSAGGLCKFDVEHAEHAGMPVTVGDVLNNILEHLRQPVEGEGDCEDYRAKRVRTLDACLQDLDTMDSEERRKTRTAEKAAGIRRVDLLCGDVRFDGVVVAGAAEPGFWLVQLQPEERYA